MMKTRPSLKLTSKATPKHIFQLKARRFNLELGRQTRIMGILNMTPDSFSNDGVLKPFGNNPIKIAAFAENLISQGADILDIGGESSRPGSARISEQEEARRVIPVIRHLAKRISIPISIDTYKEGVARQALDHGASIVNNIMGTKITKDFLKMIKRYDAAIVLMHMRGTPSTMQRHTHYRNLIEEIIEELRRSIEKCLDIGIKSDKIIIDPGIGFAKSAKDNLRILNHLGSFHVLRKPILIGTSRKSFIGKVTNRDVKGRLVGTLATVCASILKGGHIIRVHDVKEAKETATMIDAITNAA